MPDPALRPAHPTQPRPALPPRRNVQEASLGRAPPLTDAAVFMRMHERAKELDHEFREANKRALLNVVSGGCRHAASQGRVGACLLAGPRVPEGRQARAAQGGAGWSPVSREEADCEGLRQGHKEASKHSRGMCSSSGVRLPPTPAHSTLRTALPALPAPPLPPASDITSASVFFVMLSQQVPQRQILFRTIGRVFTGLSDTAKAFLIILTTGEPLLPQGGAGRAGRRWAGWLRGRLDTGKPSLVISTAGQACLILCLWAGLGWVAVGLGG